MRGVGVVGACALLAACGGLTAGAADAGSLVDASGADASTSTLRDASVEAPECPPTQASCSGLCVNLESNPDNCGTCGARCGAGLVCAIGTCTVSCSSGTTNCSRACVNTLTDSDNCGACSDRCVPGTVCDGGTCTPVCTPPEVNCSGGVCADLSSDPSNCGSCGHVCSQLADCEKSQCVPYDPCGTLTNCVTDAGSFCTNTSTDSSNCGQCGHACSPEQVCLSGMCQGICAQGQVDCGGKCIDPMTSPMFCGATPGCGVDGGWAGQPCPAGFICTGGICPVCDAPGTVLCDGTCVDPATNLQHCGATIGCGMDAGSPGVACPQGEVCLAGACAIVCQPGFVVCGGVCVAADAGCP